MGQFIKIESDLVGIAKITYLPKGDEDGVYNWPQNTDYYNGVGVLRGQRHAPSKK